jgi:preprotein translocase subunit SecD
MKLRLTGWKIISTVLICSLAIIFALPSFLHNDQYSFLPKQKVNLGLDLRGGVYILLETDVTDFLREQMRIEAEQQINTLRKNHFAASISNINEKSFSISITEVNNLALAKELLVKSLAHRYYFSESGNTITFNALEVEYKNLTDNVMARSLEIIRRRVDESGTREIELQRQGINQILLQVPGLQNPKDIKNLLGKTAKLTFHLVRDNIDINELMQGRITGVTVRELANQEAGQPRYIAIENRPILTGEMLVDAQATVQNNLPVVSFKLNAIGARIFSEVSTEYTGRPFAIVLDDKVLSAPVIREPIHGGAGVISGNFSLQSANELALLLRSGALPAPIKVMEERVIGPSLGHDSIEAGKKAVLIGMLLVMFFMVVFYRWFGLLANFALLMNLILIIAALAALGATLTLPGIAGIVLTLGMAVDANVLIFERIKEEARKGRSVLSSLSSGFDAALGTIIDANLTTLMAATILYVFGTGAVRGFAVTLSIGVASSMFSAVILVKVLVSFWYRWYQPKKLII